MLRIFKIINGSLESSRLDLIPFKGRSILVGSEDYRDENHQNILYVQVFWFIMPSHQLIYIYGNVCKRKQIHLNPLQLGWQRLKKLLITTHP